MAEKIIQSNGRTGNIQQFMLDNKAALDKIPGVDINTSVLVKNGTNQVDDILGSGTASALESLLYAAQIKARVPADQITSELNDTTKGHLRELLTEQGMGDEIVSKFIKDADAIVNDGELGSYYQSLAKADASAIRKAYEASDVSAEPKPSPPEEKEEIKDIKPTGPTVIVQEDAPEPAPEREASIAPSQNDVAMSTMALNPNTIVDNQNRIIPQEPETVFEEYGLDDGLIASHEPVVKDIISEPAAPDMLMASHSPTIPDADTFSDLNMYPISHEVVQSTDIPFTVEPEPAPVEEKEAVTEEIPVNPSQNEVAMSTMALNPNTMVDDQNRIVPQEPKTVFEEFGLDDGLIASHEPVVKDIISEPATPAPDMLVASHSPTIPAPKVLSEEFKQSDLHMYPVSREVAQSTDLSFTYKDIEKMKEGELTAEQQRIIQLVEKEHAERMQNPDLVSIKEQIADLKEEFETGRTQMQECYKSIKETAMALDFIRNAESHKPFKFEVKIDGKPQLFELSLAQIKDGNFGGINPLHFHTKKMVTEAAEKTFDERGIKDINEPFRLEIVVSHQDKGFELSLEDVMKGRFGDPTIHRPEDIEAVKQAALTAYKEQGLKNPDKPFEFEATVSKDVRIFNQSISQIRDGEFGGLAWHEFGDKDIVREAGKTAFHDLMVKYGGDYAEQVAQYNENAERLVGKENTNGHATEDFHTHYSLINVFDHRKDGEFAIVDNYTSKLLALQWKAEKMENNIEEGTYIVKRSDLDALEAQEMVAQNKTPQDQEATLSTTM